MDNENQLIAARREKLERLRALEVDPYPPRCQRTHRIGEILKAENELADTDTELTITGRLVSLRRHGKTGFVHIRDGSGTIQAYVRQDGVGAETYQIFKLLDLGDYVQVSGTAFHTRTGEFSVKASDVKILSKSLRPLPTVKEKVVDGVKQRYDEFADIELRYRKRYLDLLLNPTVREVFETRSRILSSMRRTLDNRGYLEVETPILQPLYGGANARPFITHHNTLDTDFYLRIAIELYLKRLIIGGIERVYEIGKTFRNEGMDRTHNPEFTLLESYEAYADYNDMMELTESLVAEAAEGIAKDGVVEAYGHKIDLSRPWRRAGMLDLIQEQTGFDFSDFDPDRMREYLNSREVEFDPKLSTGKLIETLFEEFVEKNLIQPTFVMDYPLEISPLAKKRQDNSRLVERFELFIAGHEYANAFSELNDPLDQRERLEAQARLRELGDLEANVVDEDFLEAMEYGMPPTGGLGIGIDRLAMLLTDNASIKEVIFFPQMKQE